MYATPLSCDNNRHIAIELDLDNEKQNERTPKPALRATSPVFGTKEVQFAVNPDFFAAQEARIYSNAKTTIFWNRVFLQNPLLVN